VTLHEHIQRECVNEESPTINRLRKKKVNKGAKRVQKTNEEKEYRKKKETKA
jgi:hypothetical protein